MRPFMLILVIAAIAGSGAAAEKPNFVLINIDDLGYADIVPFGSTLNRTPNLVRLAAEGRRLTSHYAAPVCSPSRAAMMTGCYPKRVLPIPGVLFPVAAVGLNPDEFTIAEVLKQQGYHTGCVGKWHLGDQPGMLPTDQGFDSYFGIPYSNDMGPREDGSKSSPGQERKPGKARANAKPAAKPDETGLRGDAQPPLPMLRNRQVVERVRQDGQTSLVRRYTDEAVTFLRANRAGPFFLYLAHNAVHFPHYPGLDFRGKSANGLIGDWIEEVDWSVGQVLDALRELQLDDSTLVIFTSDNGGTPASCNAPLRGFKGSTWEGGMRVCTIARWTGKIPGGTATSAITSHLDLLPTFARLAGAPLPAGRKLDGVDLWPALTGTEEPRHVFYYFRGPTLEAVREGPWKLVLASGELFDLQADVAEANNVSASHSPEMARLRQLAADMEPDLGTKAFGAGCRPLGRCDPALPLIAPDGTIRDGFRPD